MKYNTCIFDLYGTLVDIHTDETADSLWTNMASCYGIYGAHYSPEGLRRTYRQLEQEQESRLIRQEDGRKGAFPEIQLMQVFRGIFEKRGIVVGEDTVRRMGLLFRQFSTEYIRLYDGAVDLLRTLRKNGQNVYLLSNAQRLFTEKELDELQLRPWFDGIWLSSECGYRKPDRRFFERLLSEKHVEREKAIMVGNDGVCDIAGARNVGLSTLYIRSNLSPQEQLPQADYVLEQMDLAQVEIILTQD